jgi:putative ABC transport system ATP-binding protein
VMAQNSTAIQVLDVTKTYTKAGNDVTPLERANLSVTSGEFVVMKGPSGSGKSTLLNLVAGIDKPSSGRVVVSGEDITDYTEDELAGWRSRAIGYVFQQFNLMPILTAYENVELPLLLMPLNAAQRRKLVETALEVVDLSDRSDHYPRQLSGGQEQRVAIARAIVTDPQVILADEPTGNLDRDSAEAVMTILAKLNRDFGKTVLLVTHDPHVAAFGSRVMHLDKGELSEEAAG